MSRELIILTLIAAAAGSAGGCLELREPQPKEHDSNCTTCHGSPSRPGTDLTRSAPPYDVSGNNDTFSRGVGAHLIHLSNTPTHAAVACEQCHVVPEHTESVGHADSALPAEVVFGELASQDHAPGYDSGGGRCVDTYCHGGHVIEWVPRAEPHLVCGSCHGLPPAAPHPQASDCSTCHGEVIDADRRFIAPEKHVDGIVQQDERCDRCHGSGDSGAPPPDLAGNTDPSVIGVGAHTIHLAGGPSTRAVACSDCHQVPTRVGDAGHLDDSQYAELTFAGVALSGGRDPQWRRDTLRCNDSWCHGPNATSSTSPRWIDAEPLSCSGCHGMPPAAPHPQMDDCARCHGAVIDAGGSIIARERHVDGIVDVSAPSQCDSCHGSDSTGVPPPALDGSTMTSASGVGAHMRHLVASGRSRPVECGECHVVPSELLSPGHVDSARPAELSFSGAAVSYGASPSYDGMRCSGSWCHGGATAFGFPSGGQATSPLWTQVDGTQTQCNGCHAMPPPTPAHPPGPVLCSGCHTNVVGLADFVDPLLHVNGLIEVQLP